MKFLRRILEISSRNKVIRRRIALDTAEDIYLFVSPDSQLKYLKLGKKAFDRDLIYIGERLIGIDDCVWDIGANVGVFAFVASVVAAKGQVLAIEPDSWLAEVLHRTKAVDPERYKSVSILPAAISDRNGVAHLNIAKRGRASNALEQAMGRTQMGGVREVRLVATITLDDLLNYFPAPNFVKVDVEGAEDLVVAGAKRLIEQVRPVFYVEIGTAQWVSVSKLFNDANYAAYNSSGKPTKTYNDRNYFFVARENEKFQKVLEEAY